MNRKPQPADCLTKRFSRGGQQGAGGEVVCVDERCTYHTHLRNCGGQYVKVGREGEEVSGFGSYLWGI